MDAEQLRYHKLFQVVIQDAEIGWWRNPNLNVIDEVLSTTLTEREHRVLSLRFGLRPMNQTHMLREAGQIFGVTKERIRQIEAKALRKLRHPSRLKQVKNAMSEAVN